MMRQILACAALLAFGCSDTEDRRLSLIDNPRILAMSATPPVVGPGQTMRLDALVVGRGGTVADADIAWRACAPWRVVLDPAVQCGPAESTPIVDGELTAPEVIDAEVQVPVVAELEIEGVRLVAVKRVRFAPAVPVSVPGLTVDGFRLDGAMPSAIEAARDYDVGVVVSGDFGEQVDVKLNLYATAGEFQDESLELAFEADGAAAPGTTTWTAPEQLGDITFWLVATEPNGETSWLEVAMEE